MCWNRVFAVSLFIKKTYRNTRMKSESSSKYNLKITFSFHVYQSDFVSVGVDTFITLCSGVCHMWMAMLQKFIFVKFMFLCMCV